MSENESLAPAEIADTPAPEQSNALAALAALQQVSLGITSTLELGEVLQRVAKTSQELARSSHAHIFLYDPVRDELTLGASHWAPEAAAIQIRPRREGLTFQVAHTGMAQFVSDTAHHSAYAALPPERRPGAFTALPLKKGARVLGVMNLGYWQPFEFSPEMRSFLGLMAAQAAIAIDNAQLYAAAQRRAGELAALREISLDTSAELDLEKLLQAVVRRGSKLLGARGGAVYLLDAARDTLELFAEDGFERSHLGTRLALGEGLAGRVALTRKPLALEDYAHWVGRAGAYAGEPLGAAAGVPLLWKDQVLGTFALQMEAGNPRTFSPEDLRLMEQFAAQIAVAIQNANLYTHARRQAEELEQRVQELSLVGQISRQVNTLDLAQVQRRALDQLTRIFQASLTGIGLYDPVTKQVRATAVDPEDDPALGVVLDVGATPVVAQALERREPAVWQDDPAFQATPVLSFFRQRGTRFLAVAPMIVKDKVIGFLVVDPGPRAFTSAQLELLQTIANQVALAMENARLYQVALENARIENELRVARLIQQTLLPKELPALPGWELQVAYKPARAVGGDLYDVIRLNDGRIGIFVGDVTDKGVPAALMMANTHAVLRTAALQIHSPGAVLKQINDVLCPDMPPKMFVTCLYAILDPATGRIEYANAGQSIPYRWKEGRVGELRASGLPLGLLPDMDYQVGEATLTPGESVLFYSDGLTEGHSPAREMFGSKRLKQFLALHPGGDGLVEDLQAELARFTGPDWEQEDDITLVALKRCLPGIPGASPHREPDSYVI